MKLLENSVMRIRFGIKREELRGHWEDTAQKEN
jgi:hypothetical protein